MSRILKYWLLVLALAGSVSTSRAFSLLGPFEEWQQPNIGHRLGGDIGGVKDINEEYRWNVPFITYAYDPSFLTFFGSNGVAAVEEGIAIFNALPPASQMNLDDFPFEAQRFNFRAQALELTDLKSVAMNLLLEEMGLAEPDRYVWTLRSRAVVNNGTQTNYFVMQMNYDPLTLIPTNRINGALFTYSDIFDAQSVPIAFPVVEPVDPLTGPELIPVAGRGLLSGGFYAGLSRDDAGGLHELFRTNNFNVERLLPDVQLVSTNVTPTELVTQDLGLLVLRTQNTTNTPADLLSFYPGLVIVTNTSRLGLQIQTNITTYFANYPCDPVQMFLTNFTTNVVTLFDYELGNVVVLRSNATRDVLVRIVEVVPAEDFTPGLPAFRTNVLDEFIQTQPIPSGEFYIQPPNLVGFNFVSNVFSETVHSTNVDFFAESLVTIRTNRSQLELIQTFDLITFSELALTNPPATLQGLFPDLLITTVSNFFTNVVVTNTFNFFTNFPWDPAGTLTLTQGVFLTTNIATNFSYTFGNLLTNFPPNCQPFTNIDVVIEEVVTAQNPWAPAGSPPVEESFFTQVNSNLLNGTVLIIPTNLFSYEIVSTQLVDVQILTNTVIFTNFFGTGINQTNEQRFIRFSTNYFLNAFPIEFVTTNQLASNILGVRREIVSSVISNVFEVNRIELLSSTNSVALRPGVDKVRFIRMDRNSLLGQEFPPSTNVLTLGTNFVVGMDGSVLYTNVLQVTNGYVDTMILTNSGTNTLVKQVVRRGRTTPDILFTAADLGVASNGQPVRARRTVTAGWDDNSGLNSQEASGGPGVITPQIVISFNKITPWYFNFRSGFDSFLQQSTLGQTFLGVPVTFAWASFNGSTNEPVIYPLGSSINAIENQILNPAP